MSHCPYLLHKFVINYLPVWLLFCVPRLFELPTALLEYLDLLQGVAVPLPSGLLHLWLWNIQYKGTDLLLLVNPIKTITPCAPLIVWKEDTSLPAMFNSLCGRMNQKKKIKRTFVIKVATMKITNGSHHVLNRHFSWWTKMNDTQRRAILSPWRRHCM